MLNRVRQDYARVWRRVCTEWLEWTTARFERFLRAYNAYLEANDGAALFYHEAPLYHIVPLLITDRFQERLHKEVRKYKYGTPEWVYFRREILAAIEGVPKRTGRFDWDAAKQRVEEHLALYRERLPAGKSVTDFEKWILGFHNPELTRALHATAAAPGS